MLLGIYRRTIPHSPPSSLKNNISCLHYTFPRKGAPRIDLNIKDTARRKIFWLEHFVKQSIFFMVKPSHLFSKKCIVKLSKISKPHTSKGFWEAKSSPLHLLHLPCIILVPPPKFMNHCLYIFYQTKWQAKHVHRVGRDGLDHSLNHHFLPYLR